MTIVTTRIVKPKPTREVNIWVLQLGLVWGEQPRFCSTDQGKWRRKHLGRDWPHWYTGVGVRGCPEDMHPVQSSTPMERQQAHDSSYEMSPVRTPAKLPKTPNPQSQPSIQVNIILLVLFKSWEFTAYCKENLFLFWITFLCTFLIDSNCDTSQFFGTC